MDTHYIDTTSEGVSAEQPGLLILCAFYACITVVANTVGFDSPPLPQRGFKI